MAFQAVKTEFSWFRSMALPRPTSGTRIVASSDPAAFNTPFFFTNPYWKVHSNPVTMSEWKTKFIIYASQTIFEGFFLQVARAYYINQVPTPPVWKFFSFLI